MSWRDELNPKKPGNTSKIDKWVESLPDKDFSEFVELVDDRDVATSALYRVAREYGLPVLENQFGKWRREQWASAKI